MTKINFENQTTRHFQDNKDLTGFKNLPDLCNEKAVIRYLCANYSSILNFVLY